MVLLKEEISERKKAENEIKYSKLKFEAVLNNLDAFIYITDMKSNEILFMNQHMKDEFGKDLTGKICWQVLHNNQDGPCKFCKNDKLIDADGISKKPYVWEFYNQKLQQWYELRDQAIPWTDGRLVRMEIATNNRLGYDVETCTEGKETVEIYKKAMESEEPFDLVILDLTNKFGMGGQESMRKLLEIDHNTKGIIITGYFDDPVVADFKAYGFSGVITKPATRDELSKVINEVLSKGQ